MSGVKLYANLPWNLFGKMKMKMKMTAMMMKFVKRRVAFFLLHYCFAYSMMKMIFPKNVTRYDEEGLHHLFLLDYGNRHIHDLHFDDGEVHWQWLPQIHGKFGRNDGVGDNALEVFVLIGSTNSLNLHLPCHSSIPTFLGSFIPQRKQWGCEERQWMSTSRLSYCITPQTGQGYIIIHNYPQLSTIIHHDSQLFT